MVSKSYYFIVGVLLVFTLFACELFTEGYGEKVDLKSPVLEIDGDKDNEDKLEFVRKIFTISGKASDDIGISEVSLKFTSPVTGNDVVKSVKVTNKKWSIDLNSSDTTTFKDGEIEFLVTASDASGKSTKRNKLVVIDNTPPTILVNSPNSQDIMMVNGVLDIRGSLQDEYPDSVKVEIIDNDDKKIFFDGSVQGTSSWKCEFNTKDLKIGLNPKEEPRKFKIKVTASDKAKNSNSFYFYNDDLHLVKESLGVPRITIDHLADPINYEKLKHIQRSLELNNLLTVNIKQEFDTPQIILPDWDYNEKHENLDSKNYKAFSSDVFISGRILDDDGLDSVTLSIYKRSELNNFYKDISSATPLKKGTISNIVSRSFNLDISIHDESWNGWVMDNNLDSSGFSEGLYFFYITVKDIEGKETGVTSLKNPAVFGIDKNNPKVSITTPESDGFFNNSFDIKGEATDEVKISEIILYLDDEKIASSKDEVNKVTFTEKDGGVDWSFKFDPNGYEGRSYLKAEAVDGSGKNATASVALTIDKGKPTVNFLNLINNEIIHESDFQVKVDSIDKMGTIKEVKYSLNYTDNGNDLDDIWSNIVKNEFGWVINLESLTDSMDNSIFLYAIDSAGNKSDIESINYKVDLNPPTLSFTPNRTESKTDITFKGNAKDGNDLKSTTLYWSLNGVDKPNEELTPAADGDITWVLPISEGDGTYTVSVETIDIAGKKATETNTVKIDNTKPELAITKPVNGESTSIQYYEIKGTARDLGIGFDGEKDVEYKLGSGDWTELTLSGTSWSKELDLGEEEGSTTIQVRATDKLGSINTSEELTLYMDKEDPKLTETNVPNSDNIFANSDKAYKGLISDSNKISTLEVSFDGGNNFDDISSGIVKEDGKAVSWSYTFKADRNDNGSLDAQDEGEYSLLFRATDIAGKKIDVLRNVTIDAANPTIDVKAVTGYVSGTISIEGEAGDTSSKVQRVEYQLNGTSEDNWTEASGSFPWLGSLDLSSANEGANTLYVRSFDNAGNVSTIAETEVKVDKNDPTLSFTPDKTESKIDITFNGNASDSNRLESTTIHWSLNGVDKTDVELTPADGDITWVLPADEGDGTYTVSAKTIDIAGKTATVTNTVKIDTTKPELAITKPVNKESTSTQFYEISGTARDLGIGFDGVKDVEYKLGNGDWTELTLTGTSWSKELDLGGGEGSTTVQVRSTDKLGTINTSEELTLYMDKENPKLTETSVPNSDNIYIKNNKTYEGSISDSNKISTLEVSFDGGNIFDDISSGIVKEDGKAVSWSYTFNADRNNDGLLNAQDEGEYSLLFRATDIAHKKTDVLRKITIDAANPTVSVYDVTGYVSGEISIKGNAEDSSSKIERVEYQLNGTTEDNWTEASGSFPWLGSLELSSANEGANTLYVRSFDNAGNVSTIAETEVKVDKNDPTLSFTPDKTESKTDIKFTGNASDSNRLESTTIHWSLNGVDKTDVEVTPAANGDITWELPANEGDGTYTVSAKTIDIAGKSVTVTNTVKIDTTEPELAITKPVNNESTSSRIYEIKGTARDLGIGFDGEKDVEYRLGNGDWTELTLTGTSWSKELDLGEGEGSTTIQVRATDKLGIINTSEVLTLYMDKENPKLTETSVPNSDNIYIKSNKTYEGLISDSNKISTLEVSFDGGNIFDDISSGIVKEDGKAVSWSYTFNADRNNDGSLDAQDEEEYSLIFRATDIAHKKTDVLRKITVDVVNPTVNVKPVTGYVSGEISIRGNAEDSSSKIDKVEYQLNGTTEDSWTEASGSFPWLGSLELSSANEGENTLYVRSFDNAGNVSTIAETEVKVDKNDPILSFAPDKTESKTDITFTGNASDSNRLESTTIHWSLNGVDKTDVEVTPAANGDITWVLPADKGDGTYTVNAKTIDIAGKSVTVTKTVKIDTTKPELAITKPVNNESTSSRIYEIKGTARDLGIGFDGEKDVEYKLGSGDWTELTLTGTSWSKELDLGEGEGSITVQVRATDKLGTISTSEVLTLYMDKENPKINETVIGSVDVRYINNDITISGNATDSNNIRSVEVFVDGASVQLKDNLNVTSYAWNYIFDVDTDGAGVDTGFGNGKFEVKVVVTDIAGKKDEIIRNIIADTEDPTLEITTAIPYYNFGITTIEGYVSDSTAVDSVSINKQGSGIELASLTWDNVNNRFNWKAAIDLQSEGDFLLVVTAKDKAGNEIVNNGNTLLVDKAHPTFTEDSVENSGIQYISDSLTYRGSIYDYNGIESFTTKIGEAEPVNISIEDDNTWSYTVDGSNLDNNKNINIVFTATDRAKKTVIINRKIHRDRNEPTIEVTTDFSDWIGKEAILLKGHATDLPGSDIKSIEYSLDNSNWDNLSTSSGFSKLITIPEGHDNQLYIRATDNVDNIKYNPPIAVQVDISGPQLTMVDPLNVKKVNSDGFDVIVKALETNGSGIKSAILTKLGKDMPVPIDGVANGDEYTFTIPPEAFDTLTDGQQEVKVEFIDNVNNSSNHTFPVLLDITPPVSLAITSHSENDIENKTIKLSGTASDNQGLPENSVKLHVEKGTDNWEVIPVTGTYSWSANVNTSVYTADAENYDSDASKAGLQAKFRLTVTDEAGNSSEVYRTLEIDQDSDRPIIKINNLQVATVGTLKQTKTIYGTVTDDEVVTHIEISENEGTNWNYATLSGSSWEYNVTGDDGLDKEILFRVTTTDGIFTTNDTDELKKPRLYKAENVYISTPLIYNLDGEKPEIGVVNNILDSENISELKNSDSFSDKLKLSIQARDEVGIQSVVVIIPGQDLDGDGNDDLHSYTAESPEGVSDPLVFSEYKTTEINLKETNAEGKRKFLDGNAEVTIKITDYSGLESTISKSITIDNVAPIFSITNPKVDKILNGEVEVIGSVADAVNPNKPNKTGESGLSSVEYKIADRNWVTIPDDDKYSLKFKIPNIDSYKDDESTIFDELNKIYNVHLIIKATDKAGNICEGTRILKVDPDADRPRPTVIYPDPEEENCTLGGSIRVFGSATDDDDGINAVYMQIDVNGDGDFTAADNRPMTFDLNGDGFINNLDNWYDGGHVDGDGNPIYGQKINGTFSWNYTINTKGEFNPTGLDENKIIHFRVRVEDGKKLIGAWSNPQKIIVDRNVPLIGSSSPIMLEKRNNSGDVLERRNYVPYMYIKEVFTPGSKENWYLTTSIEDETALQSYKVEGSVPNLEGTYPSVPGTKSDEIEIPIPTVENDKGTLNFTISVMDNSSPANTTVKDIVIKYDNKAPTLTQYTGSTSIVNSNGVYMFESKVEEDGSDLERVGIYFIRRKNTDATNPEDDRLYAPMSSGEYFYLSELEFKNGLYYKNMSGATRDDPRTLTNSGNIDNPFIRKGGIINIGGRDRLITDYDNSIGKITWSDDDVEVSITNYSIAYAQFIDNRKIELFDEDLKPESNDDGDELLERITPYGSSFNWSATFNSKNIPDGPIEINWIAFDKAGNSSKNDETRDAHFFVGNIENNKPLLAGVSLGTDLNGNGSIELSEVKRYETAGVKRSVDSVDSGDFIIKDNTEILVEVLGGNGDLKYNMKAGSIYLKGDANTYLLLRDGEQLGDEDNVDLSNVEPIILVYEDDNGTKKELADIEEPTGGSYPEIGENIFTINIWDSTQETKLGVDSFNAVLTVPVKVDLVDGEKPTTEIIPLYWTSTSENSIYENNQDNGYIELKEDSGNDTVGEEDPDVSGIISIEGISTDNKRVNTIEVMISSMKMNGDTVSTVVSTFTIDTDDNKYKSIPVQGQWDSEGWKFNIVNETITQEEHTVKWRLDWDTSKIDNCAELDRNITVVTKDTINSSDEAKYTVDVVPYITSINNKDGEGLSDDVFRSSTGKYSIDYSITDKFVVKGFNLGDFTNHPAAYISADVITDRPNAGYIHPTLNSGFIEIAKKIENSGYLTIFVNNVASINNLSKENDKEYHKEIDITKVYSEQWTDDRYLWVWETTQVLKNNTDNQTYYYPDMIMEGDQPIFTYADNNTGVSYRTTDDTQKQELSGQYFQRQTSVAYADDKYWTLSVEDAFSSTTNDKKIGYLQLNRDETGKAAIGDPSPNFIEIVGESFKSKELNRFLYPKLIGETNVSNGADIFISYYDKHIDYQNISFVSFTSSGKDDSSTDQPASADKRMSNVIELEPVSGGGFSQYYDMVKFGTDSIAIVYYDEDKSVLRLAYNTDATDTDNLAKPANTWTTITLDKSTFSGSHVSVTSDDDFIYSAYYDSGKQNLKTVRVKISDMSVSGPVVVDAYLSVGTWTQIDVIDFDGDGTDYNQIPIISYYSDSFNGSKKPIRVAFPKDSNSITSHGVIDPSAGNNDAEKYSGNWEVITVPAKSKPKGGMDEFNHTQLGQYTSGSSSLPVVGWLADRLEYSKLKAMK